MIRVRVIFGGDRRERTRAVLHHAAVETGRREEHIHVSILDRVPQLLKGVLLDPQVLLPDPLLERPDRIRNDLFVRGRACVVDDPERHVRDFFHGHSGACRSGREDLKSR